MASILVCDDTRSICELLEITFRKEGHRVETVTSGEAANRKLDSALYDVVITDIKMPRIDGIEVLRHARKNSPDAAVILITAIEDYEAAVQALNAGAYQYIHKGPGLVEEVRVAVRRAIESISLRRQNQVYRRDAASRNTLDNIVGDSGTIQQLKQLIRTVAATSSTVLILGESGTGKELVARAVHACSPRSGEPFISINCGAFPEPLLESEIFGYVKGAFTGASQTKQGLFEAASGGTIFLDEISEMSLPMQVKLLRVLQERTVRMVGGNNETPVDVRVVAATNKDLDKEVSAHTFREDLYYRISVIPLKVPALRDRREDIPVLAHHFLRKFSSSMGKSITRISAASVDELSDYEWPGNVRQLEHAIERSVALESSDELHVELPGEKSKARAMAAAVGGSPVDGIPPEGIDLEAYVAGIERSMLQTALRKSNGVQTRAAEILKLSYRSFRHLLKKYEL